MHGSQQSATSATGEVQQAARFRRHSACRSSIDSAAPRAGATAAARSAALSAARPARARPPLGALLAAALSAMAALQPVVADAAVTGSSKFIPAMIVYYGGGPTLTSSDAARLAKYDLIDIDRFRYNQIGGNTWASIKAINPNTQIYLYEMGPESPNYMDASAPVSLNGLGRYNVARGHPMGTLNGNHPELYLTDSTGARIFSRSYSNLTAGTYWHLMDFGSSAYQSYWTTSVKADIIDQPWVADGVFADNCLTFASSGGYSGVSTKYPTDSAWSSAMNGFAGGIASGLHGYGQKLWCNKGDSRSATGAAAWRALDASANHPDILMEEGAFAVEWGAAVQFYPENEWKNQVDTIGALANTKVGLMSHTQLAPGQIGTDNWGKPVDFWQAFYYSMGSLLVGKNAANNAYLMFTSGTAYNAIVWYDEFDQIDLGAPVGTYTITNVGGVNVYWREFQRGYVAVNPTATDVAAFSLPQPVQRITHDNLYSAFSTLPSVSAISLNGHNAAILWKTGATSGGGTSGTADTTAPTVPGNLAAAAVSSSQINLTWSASTDNVGVAGYIVYLNDARLATTATTSFQHTGLVAGATYNYRVSAFDAVPNHSAWSASPVSVTVPLAGDTTAPTAPSGVTAVAASTSQVNLAWTQSTDNVSVTGYRLYRNGGPLATTGTTTTFSDGALAAGTTYSYTVAAVDGAGNTSPQSLAVSVQTLTAPTADTTAPTVPTGLTATAVSTSQINLTWNAASDNVGVTGYYVYLNDVPLATTTGTTFQHTGLVPGATYAYRVSAYDAVPNQSAWTGTVAATALSGTQTDAIAPSVPAGLVATRLSSSQIRISWNPSSDNVGVKGYYIYVNGKPLLATSSTSFTHSGLAANTTYSYRVSAFDAALNYSAWSDAQSAKTAPK